MNFSFRKRGLSKWAKRRILIVSLVFCISLVGFIFILNIQRDAFFGDKVEKASMPTVKIGSQEEVYGEFFGYKNPVDLGRVRNGLIPLDIKRNISIIINPYNKNITNPSYEVSTGSGSRRIVKDSIQNLEPAEGSQELVANLSLSNLIDEGSEYMLTLRFESDGIPLEYYMRIKYVENGFEKDCAEFARYFMETAMSDKYEELATYMEPRRSSRNGLSKVSINSSLNDVGWSGFDIDSHTEAKITFAEIDSNYTALNLRYVVFGVRGTNPGTFIVDEYYRMRRGEERIYLLDFERRLTQVFDEQTASLNENILRLGQNGNDIEFASNRTGTNVAFAWNGNLYEYNASQNILTNVFSFGKSDVNDPRSIHQEYGIEILSVDENGNLVYAVYGYMNAGAHEGECGIGLYHYDLAEDRIREQAFLRTNLPYSALKSGFEGNIYLSSSGMLYLIVEDEFLACNIDTGKVETLLSRKNGDSFAMSSEGRYLASTGRRGNEITVTDFFSGTSSTIPADIGTNMRVSSFIGEDLIYGVIRSEDYTDQNIRDDIYPMEQLIIADVTVEGGETKKQYKKEGLYITNIVLADNGNLNLELSTKTEGVFVPGGSDTIQSYSLDGESEASLSSVADGRKANVAIILAKTNQDMGPSVTMKSFDSVNLSYYSNDGENALEYIVNDDKPVYYAYRGMDVRSSSYFPTTVIHSAYAGMGYVVDHNGNYIWQYGRGGQKKSTGDIVLSDNINKRWINLTGCELEEVLSYIYRSHPVYINEGTENAMIITGFDSSTVTIYSIASGEEVALSREEASNLITAEGKKMSVYIDQVP